MKYWWVNQSGSHKIEHSMGFMWSPMKEINGARNQGYENMKNVSPGDVVFSNVDAHIVAIGRIQSYSYPADRPSEFPKFQNSQNTDGWKVTVDFRPVPKRLRHSNYRAELKPLLPEKYSPIDRNGKAAMKLYLVEIPERMADTMMQLMDLNPLDLPPVICLDYPVTIKTRPDDEVAIQKILNSSLAETEKQSLITSRHGQGLFREKVILLEQKCRFTGITNPAFLIASHIKPWRECNDFERLDGNNGLLLTPNMDRLFDRYFISFTNEGHLLISDLLDEAVVSHFGLNKGIQIGPFRTEQIPYLTHHRERLKKR